MLTRFKSARAPRSPPRLAMEPVDSRFRERVGHPQAISVRTQCDRLFACSRLLLIHDRSPLRRYRGFIRNFL